MDSLEKSIATSMDCNENDLVPYLPYILQDFWEIGSSPNIILQIIKKLKKNYSILNILDLGCGKGAVSIKLSSELQCHCLGIDAISGFIEEAKIKAKQLDVDSLCTFEINDVRQRIAELPKSYFDIIILGAIGPVFGNYYETLSKLKIYLKDNGLIIIDDGYIEDTSSYTHPLMIKKQDLLMQIENADMQMIDEVIADEKDDVSDEHQIEFENIVKRCTELIQKYPEKKSLFESYIQKQKEEYDVLENKVVCTTMVINRK
ncbi:class I SAM-dependent methyltransferase [bacterium]|nr:class I SAM-dependent methyltransferase [bacterium]